MASSPSSALCSSECMGSFISLLHLRTVVLSLSDGDVHFPFLHILCRLLPKLSCQWHWCLLGECPISSSFSFCPLVFRKYNFSLLHSCLVSGWHIWYLVQHISLFSISILEHQVPGCSTGMGSYRYNGMPDSSHKESGYLFGSWLWEALHKNTSTPRTLTLFYSISILWGVILTEHPS